MNKQVTGEKEGSLIDYIYIYLFFILDLDIIITIFFGNFVIRQKNCASHTGRPPIHIWLVAWAISREIAQNGG